MRVSKQRLINIGAFNSPHRATKMFPLFSSSKETPFPRFRSAVRIALKSGSAYRALQINRPYSRHVPLVRSARAFRFASSVESMSAKDPICPAATRAAGKIATRLRIQDDNKKGERTSERV